MKWNKRILDGDILVARESRHESNEGRPGPINQISEIGSLRCYDLVRQKTPYNTDWVL